MKKYALYILLVLLIIIAFVFFYNPKYVSDDQQIIEVENTNRSGYTSNKQIIPVEAARQYLYERYRLKDSTTNKFNTEDDLIDVEIPLTIGNLKIVSVKNVSSAYINAIVIVLDENNGAYTNSAPVTHLLDSTLKISNIKGLSIDKMRTDKKLLVYVIHDDKFHSDNLISYYKNCVKQLQTSYPIQHGSSIQCPLPKSTTLIPQPREQEGDIIGGK